MLKKYLYTIERFSNSFLPASTWLTILLLSGISLVPFLVDPLNSAVGLQIEPIFALIALVGPFFVIILVVVKTLILADAAAFAVMAKRIEQPFQPSPLLEGLEQSRFLGFLALAAEVLAAGLMLALSASSITYTLVHHLGFQNPFNADAKSWQVILYYLDQAMRGVFF